MFVSERSRRRFANLAAQSGTLGLIDEWYRGEGFTRDAEVQLPEGSMRRSLIDAYESHIDWHDEAQNHRVVRVYATAVEEVGRSVFDRELTRDADLLIRSLERDGATRHEDGGIVAPSEAQLAELSLEHFTRLRDPGVLSSHLRRIAGGLQDDPPAAIASSKELVESVCKVILEDYGVAYDRRDEILDLYKKAATALNLNAEAVPDSIPGSRASQRALRSLVATIQSLAELRNELGLGHGRAEESPALQRHARLTFHATRAVTEFLLETWHVRRGAA